MIFEEVQELRPEGPRAPNFSARITYFADGFLPVRAYLHQSGDFSPFVKNTESPIEAAYDFLLNSLVNNLNLRGDLKNFSHFLAAIWVDEGDRVVDLFKYADLQEWPGNPSVSAFVLREGIYVPEEREITCGDASIVLGQEEAYRRTTRGLDEFMRRAPSIDGLVQI